MTKKYDEYHLLNNKSCTWQSAFSSPRAISSLWVQRMCSLFKYVYWFFII